MNKLSSLKIQIFGSILALIAASIACNSPDVADAVVQVVIEKCFPVNRSQYESYAVQLGQTPETPMYPESVVYEVCYKDWERTQNPRVTSIRMTDGNSPEDNEQRDSEENNSIPAGTYIGAIDYPKSWSEYIKGESTKNEVSIQILDDGTVEGSFSLVFVGPHETYEYGDVICSGYSETEMYGSFERQIPGSSGIISVSENWDCRLFYDCNDNSTICFDGRQYDFEIMITGELMNGTPLLPDAETDSIWTFNATKE